MTRRCEKRRSCGEFVRALYKLADESAAEPKQDHFDDVPPEGSLAQSVRWAADSGIVNGYGNGKFGPDDPVTREQMAAMLYRNAQTGETKTRKNRRRTEALRSGDKREGKNDMTIKLQGRIDSGNAAMAENEIMGLLTDAGKEEPVTLDAAELKYISSAGLRVILRLKKTYPDVRIINVGSDVYEIFEMTGFTEIMEVEKAFRTVSTEGCEVIGEGFNGKVYRIDSDNVVKVYKNADALSEIRHEREVARLALILGVPTAISYDVVRVGDSYGSVFELLNARSFAKILAEEPERMDWCVKEYTDMLKKLHGITVPQGKLPSAKEKMLRAAGRMKSALPPEPGEKAERLISGIPESDKLIHGDCHTKNIVLAGDEVLLIDMDTLSVGRPVFELAQMYNSYIGFSEYDNGIVKEFQGFDQSVAREFWRKTLRAYLNTEDDGKTEEIENRIRCVAYVDLIDWKRRHSDLSSEEDRATLALWTENLTGLLRKTDCLDFEAP